MHMSAHVPHRGVDPTLVDISAISRYFNAIPYVNNGMKSFYTNAHFLK